MPSPDPSERSRARWDSLFGDEPRHEGIGALDAQALWDAAMGHSIVRALAHSPNTLVIHVAGAFHVEGGTGIPEALAHYRAGGAQLSVVFAPEAGPTEFDPSRHASDGDFVVLVRREP